MEKKISMNEYRSLFAGNKSQWQQLSSLGELIWDGVYAIRLLKDDGTLGLPFELSGEEIVNLVVKDQVCDENTQNARVVVQTLTRVERQSGNVCTYTRSRRYSNDEHRWSEWQGLGGDYELSVATTSALGGVKSYNNKGEIERNSGVIVYGVNVSEEGLPSVTVPEADNENYGVVKVDNVMSDKSINAVSGKAVANYVAEAIDTPVVNHTETTVEITPNVLNVWGEVAELNITLAAGKEGVANEYIIQFTSGNNPTILVLPSEIKWYNDKTPVIADNMVYQISILNGLAVFLYFKKATT